MYRLSALNSLVLLSQADKKDQCTSAKQNQKLFVFILLHLNTLWPLIFKTTFEDTGYLFNAYIHGRLKHLRVGLHI